MASNPFLRLIWQRVRERGGWSPILERIADGESLTKIAKDFGCSRHTMYKLLHKQDALWSLFRKARFESAWAHAEEGTEILDALARPNADGSSRVVTREDIALARERVSQRRWLAQSFDRETFGIQTPQQGDTTSIGTLHLQVLMAAAREQPKQLAPVAQPQAVDAVLVSEDPTDAKG